MGIALRIKPANLFYSQTQRMSRRPSYIHKQYISRTLVYLSNTIYRKQDTTAWEQVLSYQETWNMLQCWNFETPTESSRPLKLPSFHSMVALLLSTLLLECTF